MKQHLFQFVWICLSVCFFLCNPPVTEAAALVDSLFSHYCRVSWYLQVDLHIIGSHVQTIALHHKCMSKYYCFLQKQQLLPVAVCG